MTFWQNRETILLKAKKTRSRKITNMTGPTTFAEAQSVLAASLPGYESRPQQVELATFVEQILADGGSGICEAPTGIGKSLGTLIPAIVKGKRTVISTATISLMDQLVVKDVPFLEEHLGAPFTWALLKGRSRYVCRAKMVDADVDPVVLKTISDREQKEGLDFFGDLDDLGVSLTVRDRAQLSMASTECPGKSECPFGEICFAEQAKARAQESDIVVTNTAMLMTEIKLREKTGGQASVLGDWEALVIDEAHNLESIATDQFTDRLTENGMLDLIRDLDAFALQNNVIVETEVTDRIRRSASEFWNSLPYEEGDRIRLKRSAFIERLDNMIEMQTALGELTGKVDSISNDALAQKELAKKRMLMLRAKNMMGRYSDLVFKKDSEFARWVDTEEIKGVVTRVLMAAPVDVSKTLRDHLWSAAPSVLVSATIAQGDDFSFAQRTLGLQEARTLSVDTTFDYDSQAMLYVPPKSAPSPKSRNEWMTWMADTTTKMVKDAGGGAMLLFTSTSAMRQAYQMISPQLIDAGYQCLIQGGELNNKEMVAEFIRDEDSVLFGLKSFFEGVDVPGNACRLVVIDKLPFPVPSDPIFAARSELIESQGGSSFKDLSIPIMTLTLTQAFGRLIRKSTDRGVVAIMDSRLSSSAWGRKIVRDLPECPRTTDELDVKKFFGKRA